MQKKIHLKPKNFRLMVRLALAIWLMQGANPKDKMAKPRKRTMDEVDFAIAKALMADPDHTLKSLGEIVGLTASSCKERRDFLIKQELLVHSFQVHRKGSQWKDIRLLPLKLSDATGDALDRLDKLVNAIPEVVAAYTLAGDRYDALLWIESIDGDRYETIRRMVKENFPGVGPTTSIVQTLRSHSTRADQPA